MIMTLSRGEAPISLVNHPCKSCFAWSKLVSEVMVPLLLTQDHMCNLVPRILGGMKVNWLDAWMSEKMQNRVTSTLNNREIELRMWIDCLGIHTSERLIQQCTCCPNKEDTSRNDQCQKGTSDLLYAWQINNYEMTWKKKMQHELTSWAYILTVHK